MKEETKTQKQPAKGKKIAKAIINTIINILIVIVLITSIIIAVLSLTSKSSGISTLFGYTVQPIQSDSMKGGSPDGYKGGDFERGDLMIGRATNFDPNATYHVGDIITYRTKDTDGNVALVSHRIVKAVDLPGGMRYQTWGDNREVSEVPDQLDENDYIPAGQIGSVFYSDADESKNGFILKGVGTVLDYLRTQQGFFLAVLLPMIIFFVYARVRVVLSATDYKKSKAQEDKDEAVKAAVAAALAEKNSNEEKAAATPADMTPEQMEQFKQFMEFQKMQKQEKPQEAEAEAPAENAAEDQPAEDEV